MSFKFEIEYNPNVRVYDGKDYAYIVNIYYNSIVIYSGKFTSVDECYDKVSEFEKTFVK